MRRFYRIFWLPLYRRWALRYIRKDRFFRYGPLRIMVPAGVFHPGIYFSTPIMLRFLKCAGLAGKTVLDIGTGSGALGLFAALQGGLVTAIDINPAAVEAARGNALLNGLPERPTQGGKYFQALQSDLFDAVPPQIFDYILINPPFYAAQPKDAADHAFYAGPELEYFRKLFRQMPAYMGPDTLVWMILSEDCDFNTISTLADQHGIELPVVYEQKKWGERLFIVQAKSRKIGQRDHENPKIL
jgi:release factor glutamine methyltransferase